MLGLASTEDPVTSFSDDLRSERYVGVAETHLLDTVSGEESGSLTPKNSLQEPAVRCSGDCDNEINWTMRRDPVLHRSLDIYI